MKSINLTSLAVIMILLTIGLSSCGDDNPILFSIEDDIRLGMQTDSIIENDPMFNIMPESQNQQAYAYLNSMKDVILASDEVRYRDEFPWELHIINDTILNAFATPGGYIYIYTGLIHYLDDASSLAGVLGHEIAHSDRRHSSQQIQKQYGIAFLLDALLGDNLAALGQVAQGLLSLSFSRSDETESDNYSVAYLCDTDFESFGASKFFQKIVDQGGQSPPQFLSTHPNPDNRVENILEMAEMSECGTEQASPSINNMSYDQFKALLPR